MLQRIISIKNVGRFKIRSLLCHITALRKPALRPLRRVTPSASKTDPGGLSLRVGCVRHRTGVAQRRPRAMSASSASRSPRRGRRRRLGARSGKDTAQDRWTTE